jgi:hypothetical protein
MSEWISVKDQMPPGHELIYFLFEHGLQLGYFDSDNGGVFIHIGTGSPIGTVTHWALQEDAA